MKKILTSGMILFYFASIAWNQEDKLPQNKIYSPAYFCEINTGILTVGDLQGFAHVKNGFSLNKHLDLSLVLGLEGYSTGKYLPIFIEGRYNFLKGKTQPFVSFAGGFLQVIQERTYYNGTTSSKHFGFSGGGKLGVRHQFSTGLSIVSSIGYRYTYAQYEQNNYDWWGQLPFEPITMIHNMNRFELSIGLIFK